MKPADVRACLFDLSSKKCEGFDRIPVCAQFDAKFALLDPLAILKSANNKHSAYCKARIVPTTQ